MKNEKEKPFISDKLSKLIYNPDLPPNWEKMPAYEKLEMFHYLFLALNPNFQRLMGEEFEAYIEIEEAKSSGKKRYENHWFLYDKYKKNNFLKYKRCQSCEHRDKLLLCRGTFNFSQLYEFLRRGDLILMLYGTLDEDDLKEMGLSHKLSSYSEDFMRTGELITENNNVAVHEEYIRMREQGIIPDVIYPAIPLLYPRRKVLRHLLKFIDMMQKKYFEHHPELKSWGYEPLKSDGRRVSYPFDEWERYYKVHVLQERDNLKQKGLVKKFFPGEDFENAASKINKDITKATNLINNAWAGDFPGDY